MRSDHIEIYRHEGGGLRAEHHGKTHIKHFPKQGAKEGVTAEEMHAHLEEPMVAMESGEPEAATEEEAPKMEMRSEMKRGHLGIKPGTPVRSI